MNLQVPSHRVTGNFQWFKFFRHRGQINRWQKWVPRVSPSG